MARQKSLATIHKERAKAFAQSVADVNSAKVAFSNAQHKMTREGENLKRSRAVYEDELQIVRCHQADENQVAGKYLDHIISGLSYQVGVVFHLDILGTKHVARIATGSHATEFQVAVPGSVATLERYNADWKQTQEETTARLEDAYQNLLRRAGIADENGDLGDAPSVLCYVSHAGDGKTVLYTATSAGLELTDKIISERLQEIEDALQDYQDRLFRTEEALAQAEAAHNELIKLFQEVPI